LPPTSRADRLGMLLEAGLLTRSGDPNHKQKAVCSLTEKAIALVPVFAQIGAWGSRPLPATEALCIRARLMEPGGPPLWEWFMAELRQEHLRDGLPPGPCVPSWKRLTRGWLRKERLAQQQAEGPHNDCNECRRNLSPAPPS
jgi:hypothetical protein